MSGASKKLMGTTAAGGGGFTAIEDVFSTYLYTGNGSTQTITNDIDLAGEGGLTWIKSRSAATNHFLFDTLRGVNSEINSNTTDAAATLANSVTAFNSDGFSLGSAAGINVSAATYASWTFRKAPRFFDVVTYTGTGANRTVSHDLGTTVGSIIIKRTDTTSNWAVYHRGNTASPETDYLSLNLTSATADDATFWNDTAPTDSVFTVGTNAAVNASGGTYVAYLYAHDPLGPSGDGSDGLIACGSYTGNGSSSGPEIDLGWEPQWLLIKNASLSTENWVIFDTMRGLVVGTGDKYLRPNLSNAESAATTAISPQPNGFKLAGASGEWNGNGNTMIYIAIRRGPMRVPESGTEVFSPVAYTGNAVDDRLITTGFPVDYLFATSRSLLNNDGNVFDRMRGAKKRLVTQSTAAESTMSNNFYVDGLDSNTGFILGGSGGLNSNAGTFISHAFRRAPNFFDVVAYTGTGNTGYIIDGFYTQTLGHNLGVVPELVIIKNRSSGVANAYWVVSPPIGTGYLRLNDTNAYDTFSAFFSNKSYWTDTTWNVQGAGTANNASGNTYIAYLFATLAGVSKVGSYTGNGSNQTINCGFTSGARFILIKRTDSTGDWYVWDTARGIVTGNDPHLSLNTTAAEVTSDDSIDPASSGFIVNQVAATNINVSSASYIFYAVS